jgi:hypothetical protein
VLAYYLIPSVLRSITRFVIKPGFRGMKACGRSAIRGLRAMAPLGARAARAGTRLRAAAWRFAAQSDALFEGRRLVMLLGVAIAVIPIGATGAMAAGFGP